MRLKTLTLRNFRCFEHLEIDLHPRLTVFIAENGGGKTAVLDALAIGLSPVLRHLSSANQRLNGLGFKDTDFRLESWEGRGGRERWGKSDYAQIELETAQGLRWDNWKPSVSGKEPERKVGESSLSGYLLGIADSLKSAAPSLLPVFAYYGAKRGHIEIPERLRESKVNYAYATSALFGALDAMSDFKEMLKWFDIEEGDELRANKGAGEDFSPSQSLDAVRTAVEWLLGGAYSNPHIRDRKFVVDPVEGGAPLQVSQLSQGYQAMLALGMDFARRLALANGHMNYLDWPSVEPSINELKEQGRYSEGNEELPKAAPMIAPAIMLVDEIDLHLHPSWQQRVLGDLMRTFPNTQFIVTTHSPQVLSTVKREQIRILKQTETGYEAVMPDFSPLAHESGDALAKVMGTQKQPPLPILETVREFERTVRSGEENSDAARVLRRVLDDAGYQIHESDLATWRFLAQRHAAKGA